MSNYFPAEWHPQQAIQITWPHSNTDWAWIIDEAQAFYYKLARTILTLQDLVISVPNDGLKKELECSFKDSKFQCRIYICPSNDTWARDHGPISVFNRGSLEIQDYQFNGWGNKFEAQLDNQITSSLFKKGAYKGANLKSYDLVLEGGSLESDGKGSLLTTKQCLLNKNRNPSYSQHEIEKQLKTQLGCENILWLEHGDLEGDDTDAHIDTLARFIPNNGIVFQGCENAQDEHFTNLNKMKKQLETFRNTKGQPYNLFELPLPNAIYEDLGTTEEQRLPASYANFLILNTAVLLPVYNVPQDKIAIDVMIRAMPEHDIIPVDCTLLIRQYGSLHCITMQIPTPTKETSKA